MRRDQVAAARRREFGAEAEPHPPFWFAADLAGKVCAGYVLFVQRIDVGAGEVDAQRWWLPVRFEVGTFASASRVVTTCCGSAPLPFAARVAFAIEIFVIVYKYMHNDSRVRRNS